MAKFEKTKITLWTVSEIGSNWVIEHTKDNKIYKLYWGGDKMTIKSPVKPVVKSSFYDMLMYIYNNNLSFTSDVHIMVDVKEIDPELESQFPLLMVTFIEDGVTTQLQDIYNKFDVILLCKHLGLFMLAKVLFMASLITVEQIADIVNYWLEMGKSTPPAVEEDLGEMTLAMGLMGIPKDTIDDLEVSFRSYLKI